MSDASGEHLLPLSQQELVALYLLLTSCEQDLDSVQRDVFDRVSGRLYQLLSVEQVEHIEDYYRSL